MIFDLVVPSEKYHAGSIGILHACPNHVMIYYLVSGRNDVSSFYCRS